RPDRGRRFVCAQAQARSGRHSICGASAHRLLRYGGDPRSRQRGVASSASSLAQRSRAARLGIFAVGSGAGSDSRSVSARNGALDTAIPFPERIFATNRRSVRNGNLFLGRGSKPSTSPVGGTTTRTVPSFLAIHPHAQWFDPHFATEPALLPSLPP